MKRISIFWLIAFLIPQFAPAQNADPLVYTVGNSYALPGGQACNYLLWQPGDFSTTYGKRFAVYRKPGNAATASPYVRLSIQTVQTSPSAIQALLKLGAKVDHDAAALPERITALHAEARAQPLPPGFIMPTEITIDVAQRLAQIMSTASTDPEILQSLVSLGRAHPGVMLSMGHAFSIEVAAGATNTYEVREIDGGNNDLRVVGRVTLRGAVTDILPAPGRPFPNPHPVDPDLQLAASAKDHLNVRLRWVMSNTLRNELPKSYGFNLYRVPKVGGLDPLTITTEAQALVQPGAVRVNELPISASDLFTDAEAADLGIKREVFFYADDKNPPADPFVDGETFFYYVATRDIAGHPGPLSLPTEVTMCDRLPPSQPSILTVENVFDFDTADVPKREGNQHLRVVIRQVPELPVENRATKYRVYRWHSATDWQRYGGDPDFNFIGEVNHQEGEQFVFFDDNDITDTDTDFVSIANNGPDTGAAVATSQSDFNMGKTFWYTVRAVDSASCDPPNMSGHSGALYGVLRDRVGPDRPSGQVEYCFCLPQIETLGEVPVERKRYGIADDFGGSILRVERISQGDKPGILKKIKSFEVQIGRVGQEGFEPDYSRVEYFQGMAPFAEIPIPVLPGGEQIIRVRVRLDDRAVSGWASRNYTSQANEAEGEISLFTAQGFVNKICRPVAGVPGGIPPGHYPIGEGGVLTPIGGIVTATPTTKEVRVYRRVGKTAPLQLIFKIGGDGLVGNVPWSESSPVISNGVEVCYFAQLFDEHGNGSPLVRLGCVTIVNDDFGIPILSEAVPRQPLGGKGVLDIPWFCDPVGIDRFEVWIASETDAEPDVVSLDLSGKLETGSSPILTTPEGEELTFCIFQTPRIEAGFGDGAEFSIKVQVPFGKKYYYVIRPVGEMIPDGGGNFTRAEGDFSNMIASAYAVPGDPKQPVIPWPARPLPGSADIELKISQYTRREGPFYATSINPELMRSEGCSGAILVGALPSPRGFDDNQNGAIAAPPSVVPLSWLFNYRKQAVITASDQTSSIRRFVVYRHQVSSERFPDARPNLVQITPLIDRITYYDNPAIGARILEDPFFLFKRYENTGAPDFFVPYQGTFSRAPSKFTVNTALASAAINDYLKFPAQYLMDQTHDGVTMWVKDTMPVTRGASYQHLIVHFTPRGEIARVIPTNIISH